MSSIKRRHEAIIELLKQAGGQLSVSDLSDELNVSPVTIRQDLRALAEERVLDRIYGGAVLRANMPMAAELSFEMRQYTARREKAAIGRAAAALVKDGYGIALDGSTTTYALVPFLKQFNKLTIVTNSLIVAQSFRDTPQNQVWLPAGRLRVEAATIVGGLEGLPALNLNIGFFGAWGVSLSGGISDVDPDEGNMRRTLMERCLETVILADRRKWGETAPYTYAQPEEANRIITSADALPELVEAYRARGVMVDCVPVE